MVLRKVWIIPLFTIIFSLSAFIISYFIALSEGHVTAFWPYISDSGTLPPESCIFGQLLNLAAVFFAITVYLRHRQLIEFYWHHLKQRDGSWRSYSMICLWFGYFSAFGVSLIGNFQEINFIIIHYTGAFLAFGCGLIYTWAQTIFSFRMKPKFIKSIIPHCRLFLSCLSTIFFITVATFGTIFGDQQETWSTSNQLQKWTPEKSNYIGHTIATCSEWLLAICFEIYILTFAIELRSASCHAPKLTLNLNNLYQSYQFNHNFTDKNKLNNVQYQCSNINDNPISISVASDFKSNINDTRCNADSIKLPINAYFSNNSSRF